MSRENPSAAAAAAAESEEKKTFEEDHFFDSTLESVNKAEDIVEKQLAAFGWPEDIAYRFCLSVREAMANAVIHGNLGLTMGKDEDGYSARIAEAQRSEENKAKRVKVYYHLTKDEATVHIKDEGNFIPTIKRDPTTGEALLKGSGRGLFLIDKGIDNLQFFPGEIILHKQNRDEDAI
ncbi:MAG TPA: ATP-binding protein [Candidatus Paceibacterota bacterium]|nr:ATP-binding protein [Candidatus Paceibacterota bacterium]